MMYLVEKNFDLATKKVFENKEEAICLAKDWAEAYPNAYVNVAELTECMPTIWESGVKPY